MLGPQTWPRDLGLDPNLHLPAVAPNLHLPALAAKLYLPALTPNLYLPALALNFYYQSRASACISDLVPPIRIYWPWPTICIASLGSELAFTFLLVVVAVVVVILAVVVISLE